jgi:dihydroorotase
MGLGTGNLSPGRPADITVIDPNLKKPVDISKFYSKGKNTPYKGQELKGWPCLTMINGLIAAKDGLIL